MSEIRTLFTKVSDQKLMIKVTETPFAKDMKTNFNLEISCESWNFLDNQDIDNLVLLSQTYDLKFRIQFEDRVIEMANIAVTD